MQSSSMINFLFENTNILKKVRELAGNMPAVARILLRLARGQREVLEREEAWAARLGLDRSELGTVKPMPFEEVRDFFYARQIGV